MLSEKEKPLCSRQRLIVIFCFQNSQANNADAATIKALPASDSSIGAVTAAPQAPKLPPVHSCHLTVQGKPQSRPARQESYQYCRRCLGINKRTIIGWERDGRYPRSVEMLEKMADIFHVPLTYLQPDQSLFIERAAEAYGKKGKIEAQHLAFELTELFASGDLTPQDMDGIMYEMHKAYFKYREKKREKERIMNL